MEELIELQENLKKYAGRTVNEVGKLINLHIGAVNSFRIGLNPLCINFNAQKQSYITTQFKELTVTLEENRILCEGRSVTYEYTFS